MTEIPATTVGFRSTYSSVSTVRSKYASVASPDLIVSFENGAWPHHLLIMNLAIYERSAVVTYHSLSGVTKGLSVFKTAGLA